MNTYLAILALSFLVTHVATPVIHRLAYAVGALDVPDERKIHSRITPRLGGLAVFIGFWTAFGLALWFQPRLRGALSPSIAGLAVGSLIIVAVGIYDDVKGAGPWVKFPFQVAAAVVAFASDVHFTLLSDIPAAFTSGVHAVSLTYWTSFLLTVLWIVGVTNAMNFIDGVDALAGGLSFIVAVTLFIVALNLQQFFHAAIYLALIGSTLGFGRYNKYPAQIFLGDTGSTFLGYMLACTSILACHKSTAFGCMLIPVVALGIPISDTSYAVLRRLVLGKSVLQADRGHLHHRLLELGYTPREVVWIIYVLSIALSLGVFFLIHAQNEFAALIVAMTTVGAFVVAGKLKLLDFERMKQREGAERPPEQPTEPPPEPPKA